MQGTYQVTITDDNTCEATLNVTLESAGDLQIDPIADLSDLCPDSEVGSILLGSNLFNPDIEYSWTGGASVGLVDGTSSGLNASISSFTSAATFGSATLTVTASLNGCESTTTFDITIEDNEAPMFVNCPVGPITVGNDFSNCAGGVNWSVPIAEDNCSIASVSQFSGPAPGQILAVGVYDIGYEVVDASGNVDTCEFVVEVIDSQDPIIVCQKDMEMSADDGACSWTSEADELLPTLAIENCSASLTYEITDANGNVVSDSGYVQPYSFPAGENEICYTLTDSVGMQIATCCFTITVVDRDLPLIKLSCRYRGECRYGRV